MTEQQWQALKLWVEREASDRAIGLSSRPGHRSFEEKAAREAFGLSRDGPGDLEKRGVAWRQYLSVPGIGATQ